MIDAMSERNIVQETDNAIYLLFPLLSVFVSKHVDVDCTVACLCREDIASIDLTKFEICCRLSQKRARQTLRAANLAMDAIMHRGDI